MYILLYILLLSSAVYSNSVRSGIRRLSEPGLIRRTEAIGSDDTDGIEGLIGVLGGAVAVDSATRDRHNGERSSPTNSMPTARQDATVPASGDSGRAPRNAGLNFRCAVPERCGQVRRVRCRK